MASRKKAVEEVLSKFMEPRGVIRRTPAGSEIVVPAVPSARPVQPTLGDLKEGLNTPDIAALAERSGNPRAAVFSGPTDEEALKAYGAVYGQPAAQQQIIEEAAGAGKGRYEKALEDYLSKKKSGEITKTDKISELAGQALGLPGALKKKAAAAIAKSIRGAAADTTDEDLTFEAVDALAERLGLPASSPAVQTGKAGVAAAIDALAPESLLEFLPVGKVAKAASKLKGAKKILKGLPEDKVTKPFVVGDSKLLRQGEANMLEQVRRDASLKALPDVFRPRLASDSTAAKLAAQGAKVVENTTNTPSNLVKAIVTGKLVPTKAQAEQIRKQILEARKAK